ncbi:hypothetical protein EPJ64_04530 [Brachyspira aalborgi]|jgi:predicted GTPase|uniref:G domain-containing protein n=1 Tax=Brachyspira aalborgi TaxID=29522 RepID=A0AB38Q0Y6_9SPIR|nr:GTPase domain-containing protein [Brachyspira aalborgi]TXJ15902.1 hypothetical protein EPJ77_04550 [Brachyspira aalborgi]TXJ19402.1 hypothetical protein EPJ64_04530 [Brachyspira aalborgi]TXJ26153.1 hypothetical protein EPJ73_04895 [Brachyspira aalborgi]TXJ48704.1 hypothetical protein EPJ75_04810 [Brachyspira aalborgi]
MTEEQKKKCEEIINSYEEKYNKDFEEALTNISNAPEILNVTINDVKEIKNYIPMLLFWYDKSDLKWNIVSPLHLEPTPQDKARAKFLELLAKTKDKTVENIIDLTIDLSEVFGNGITKEEAKKLLFNKKATKMDGTFSYLNIFTEATEEFIKIMKNYEKGYFEYENYEEEICSIKNIGEAIANYFEKEKIMSNNNDELTLNLLILGQTGVGKSSLINALVGEYIEIFFNKDGIFPHQHEIDGKKVVIYDSWGLEVGKDEKWEKIINNALKEKGVDKDIKDWFHSVTYCIQAGGYKIQDFDIEIIKQFVDEGYNVIVALTKSDQIGKAKREEFIDKIKKEVKEKTKKDIMVITVSASPEQLDNMTEKPKPFGLEEYKAAILISWREIFINRIPLHIIEKLKKDILNAKSNAPRKGKELSNKIQKHFSNILNTNIQKYVRESIEKYYNINVDILAASKNINLSNKELDLNFHSEFDDDGTIEMFADAFRNLGDFEVGDRIKVILLAPLAIPLVILENFGKFLDFIGYIAFEKNEKIEKFIKDVSEEYTKKIGEEEFESEIRKIIINALNEIDKKIIKLN